VSDKLRCVGQVGGGLGHSHSILASDVMLNSLQMKRIEPRRDSLYLVQPGSNVKTKLR